MWDDLRMCAFVHYATLFVPFSSAFFGDNNVAAAVLLAGQDREDVLGVELDGVTTNLYHQHVGVRLIDVQRSQTRSILVQNKTSPVSQAYTQRTEELSTESILIFVEGVWTRSLQAKERVLFLIRMVDSLCSAADGLAYTARFLHSDLLSQN